MLTEKQIKIAAAVVLGEKNITEIMRENGVTRKTYYEWVKTLPEFSELIKDLQEESRNTALNIIKAGSAKAAKLLIRAVEDGKIAKSRIDAANSILSKSGITPEVLYRPGNQEPVEHQPLDADEIRRLISDCKEKAAEKERLRLVEDEG